MKQVNINVRDFMFVIVLIGLAIFSAFQIRPLLLGFSIGYIVIIVLSILVSILIVSKFNIIVYEDETLTISSIKGKRVISKEEIIHVKKQISRNGESTDLARTVHYYQLILTLHDERKITLYITNEQVWNLLFGEFFQTKKEDYNQ